MTKEIRAYILAACRISQVTCRVGYRWDSCVRTILIATDEAVSIYDGNTAISQAALSVWDRLTVDERKVMYYAEERERALQTS